LGLCGFDKSSQPIGSTATPRPFTTDVLRAQQLGPTLLLGQPSIHVAHTEGEYVEKKQLGEAVKLYCEVAKKLSRS
jgi:acetylornithine deacetylase/succinyl-diaminopimelate desuccinylase-like protein